MNGVIRCIRNGVFLSVCITGAIGCQSPSTYCNSPDCASAYEACGVDCAESDCRSCDKRSKKEKHDELWHDLTSDRCWPYQYARESRRRVYEPFRQQVQNGENLELTLWTHYFVDEENEPTPALNLAGEQRLKYLARRHPNRNPNLHLQTSYDPSLDQQRIDNIVKFANGLTHAKGESLPWNVTLVDVETPGIFGREAPSAINKAIGPGPGIPDISIPVYEPAIKRDFQETFQEIQ